MAYLKSLLARIEQQGFPITDPLRLRVLFTLDQAEALQQVVEKLATNRVNRDTYMMGVKPRDWKRQQRKKRNWWLLWRDSCAVVKRPNHMRLKEHRPMCPKRVANWLNCIVVGEKQLRRVGITIGSDSILNVH